jgi:hypothetical protein
MLRNRIQYTWTLIFQFYSVAIIMDKINKQGFRIIEIHFYTLPWIITHYACRCQNNISKWFMIYVYLPVHYSLTEYKTTNLVVRTVWGLAIIGELFMLFRKMRQLTILFIMFFHPNGTTQLPNEELSLNYY